MTHKYSNLILFPKLILTPPVTLGISMSMHSITMNIYFSKARIRFPLPSVFNKMYKKMFGWILLWGRQQFWITIIWPLFSVSLFAVRSLMSNYPLYNYPSSASSSHLMIHFGISLNQQQTKTERLLILLRDFSGEKVGTRRQSYKINLVWKKTKIVLNSLKVIYLMLDHNNSIVKSKLKWCTIKKFFTNLVFVKTKYIL